MARPKLSPYDKHAQISAKRKSVIYAAGQAFRRHGYHNTSMTNIARALGLSKPALYYYVKSKEEILYECHLSVYEAMDGLIAKTLKQSVQQSGLDILANLYGEFVKLMTRDGLALLADVDSLKGSYRETVLERRGKIERAVSALVKQGIKDGSIIEKDPRLTVFFFMGALNWLNVWYKDDGRLSSDEISAHFVNQLTQGIANKIK